jgi:lipopolysaccharide export system protein LptA
MNKGDVEANGGAGAGQSNGGRVKIVIPPSTNKTFPGARD